MSLKKGLLISYEGIDGSGKSTQVKLLAGKLANEGYKVKTFKFHRKDTPIGRLIECAITSKVQIDHVALQYLFIADQLDAQEEIKEYLNKGYIVLLDRYDLSTIAYSVMRINTGDIINIQKPLIKPDITVYLTMINKFSEVKKRIHDRGIINDFDKETDRLSLIEGAYTGIISRFYKTNNTLDDRKILTINGALDRLDIENYVYNYINDNYLK